MPKINPPATNVQIPRVHKTHLKPKVNSYVADVVIARLRPGDQTPMNDAQCEFSFPYGGITYHALLIPTVQSHPYTTLSQPSIQFCDVQDDRRLWMFANWNKNDPINEMDVFAIAVADAREFIPHYDRYLREFWRPSHKPGDTDASIGIRRKGTNWLLGRHDIENKLSVANHHANWVLSSAEIQHLHEGIKAAPPKAKGAQ